jgi:hypothetical protein
VSAVNRSVSDVELCLLAIEQPGPTILADLRIQRRLRTAIQEGDPRVDQGLFYALAKQGLGVDAESPRKLLLDLHEAEHVRNFRLRVVVDEKVEVAVRLRHAKSPGTEHEEPGRSVLAEGGVARPQNSISAAWFIGSDNGTVRPKLNWPRQFVAVAPPRGGCAESDQIQHDESHLTY